MDYINKESPLQYYDSYLDDEVSGISFDRPSWNSLLRYVDNGLVNCIVVKDLSRLGRNYIAVSDYLEKRFLEKDIRFIAVSRWICFSGLRGYNG